MFINIWVSWSRGAIWLIVLLFFVCFVFLSFSHYDHPGKLITLQGVQLQSDCPKIGLKTTSARITNPPPNLILKTWWEFHSDPNKYQIFHQQNKSVFPNTKYTKTHHILKQRIILKPLQPTQRLAQLSHHGPQLVHDGAFPQMQLLEKLPKLLVWISSLSSSLLINTLSLFEDLYFIITLSLFKVHFWLNRFHFSGFTFDQPTFTLGIFPQGILQTGAYTCEKKIVWTFP